MNDDNLVEIQNLEVVFESKDSTITAVDNINLNIPKNSIVGIVGESGSGKSNTGLSILNLIPDNKLFHMTDLMEAVKIKGGSVGVFPISENNWIFYPFLL